jgi:hypothetical protein
MSLSVIFRFPVSIRSAHTASQDFTITVKPFLNSIRVSVAEKVRCTHCSKEDLQRDGVISKLNLSVELPTTGIPGSTS